VLRVSTILLRFAAAAFFIVGAGLTVHAQTTAISGVINQYVQVTNVIPCDSTVAVGNPSSFQPGDRVLLMQMKGAVITTDNTSSFGQITDIASAGNAEFLTIKAVVNEYIIFTTRMANYYDTDIGFVQLIRVPVYNNARVVGPLQAPEWNGTVGGVIAFEVSGWVSIEVNVSADGLGFRGGRVSLPIDACSTTDYVLNWNFGKAGEKGEGIGSMRANYPIAGRGPMATGGGGGNGTNSGGAGGSNGGAGGSGGNSVNHCSIKDVGGRPGISAAQYARMGRLFLGGGGGGGHQNDLVGTSGAHGGGMIIIRASELRGNNLTISADGLSVGDAPPPGPGKNEGMDGAGGGGAGGTVVLDVDVVSSPINIRVRGGNGGNIKHLYNAHGPGGGGSGGVVVLKTALNNVNIDVSGGVSGTHVNSSNEAYGQSNGASDGQDGISVSPLVWKSPISVGLEAWGGGVICEGLETARIEATPGFASYTWSNGMTGRVINVDKAGTYSVTAVDSSGCIFSAGNVPVSYNPIKFTMPSALDFGDVPFEATVREYIRIDNTDDEPIELTRITGGSYFKIVDPTSFPLVIPRGGSYNVAVEFYAGEDRYHVESMRFYFDRPCPDSQDVLFTAVVRPIWATLFIPDTVATVGDSTFTIPIYASVRPDTVFLNETHLRISIEMDSRVFSPTSVTRGRLTTNTIDLLTNKRTLTIEVESIDLRQDRNLVTSITGIVLMSTVTATPITFLETEWVKVWQVPITDYQNGSLLVEDVCYQAGRLIRMYDRPTMSISPNPAQDVVNIRTNLSAPGDYSVRIMDLLGETLYEESLHYTDDSSSEHTFQLDASSWAGGQYIVMYSTPLLSFTDRIVIQR